MLVLRVEYGLNHNIRIHHFSKLALMSGNVWKCASYGLSDSRFHSGIHLYGKWICAVICDFIIGRSRCVFLALHRDFGTFTLRLPLDLEVGDGVLSLLSRSTSLCKGQSPPFYILNTSPWFYSTSFTIF